MLVDINRVTVKTCTMKDNSTIREVFLNEFFAQKYNLIITKLD
jgi:hypothetical protein